MLAAYVGETVTIRYDPRDAAELRVYHHDQYLCRAIAPELAADTVTLQQLQQARTARRRQLKQRLRDRRSLADALPADQRNLPAAAAPAQVAAGLEQAGCPCRPPHRQPRRHRHIGSGPMPPTDRAAERSLLGKNYDGRRFLTAAIGELGGHPPVEAPTAAPFLDTREHRRFTEFADAVRQHRYIGLCWGPPGVGKTLSARRYAGLQDWEQWQRDLDAADTGTSPGPVPARVMQARTAVWTPTVTASPREVAQALPRACQHISYAVDYDQHGQVDPYVHNTSRGSGLTELLIVDEADRLKTTGLEQVRDYYDRHHLGVILIGMPGTEKRLARYPQLYSRVGFAHEYRPLSTEELTAVLTRRWHTDGLASSTDGFTESVAIATIARITGGNFRLVDRLLSQVQRIQQIDHLETITPEVVEAAREALLIGR